MTTEHERRGALEAIERIVNRGGEAGSVFAAAESALRPLFEDVAIVPAGASDDTGAARFTIGSAAALRVTGFEEADRVFLERVALLLSAYAVAEP